MTRCLLVEPNAKGWGANNQYVGLLRIGTWLVDTGNQVEYVVYPDRPSFTPDEIWTTSMFTYDYRSVEEATSYYKTLFPSAKSYLGGIYASICPEHAASLAGVDEVIPGRHPEAMYYPPDPTLLPKRPKLAYLFTGYGCNRACTYCATHIIHGKGIEQTDSSRVIDEIQFLVERGFNRIRFGDDNILFDSENHLNVICEKIITWGVKLTLDAPGGMSAIDLTSKTAGLMKRAGFDSFSFGLESVSSAVRTKMGRAAHTGEDDLIRAIRMCDNLGISRKDINVFFIIGLPYQTLEDMIGTLLFLLKLGVWAHPQRFTPIPNTVEWKRMGLEDWDLADLHYNKFVAPGQDNFTGDDLRDIYNIARFFNIGTRMTGGGHWLGEESRTHKMFRQLMKDML